MPFYAIIFHLFGFRLQDYPHSILRHPLSKTKFRNFLEMPVFMTVNIPWETNCGVIAGTIKWTKAMQLRQRKSKTGEQENKQILLH